MSKDKKEIEFNENLEAVEAENLDFETALENLQKIVEDLEKGGLSLDKTLAEFSQGMKLLKFCHQKLDGAEKKIELMLKDDDQFTEEVPFDSEIEED
ncbi:exodeoxyribonuclease VII small subunit [Halanaerobium saccharolyticum]|jgi:exodeoxyribonuclease VII small subunit|uniref:Exodeoxyribonuclease 7 small subunit n=1 Tax=Halanaerobium saccharolyticum TaxID=43595 RepID=A0A4R6SAN8_9FIRM|nr:exodeoxyribonuclease VII small subunit [Halanaerobium saccharolyticum]TDP97000.1 exodeoxyribonuclease VII small subunit [Halanaerobium saccharolyticum]